MPKSGQIGLRLRFRSAPVGTDEVQAELNSALEDAVDPNTALARGARALGISPEEFRNASATVEEEGKGFGDVIVLVAIFAPAANHAIRTLWDDLILPRIKSRLGADAVGEELADDEDEDGDGEAES